MTSLRRLRRLRRLRDRAVRRRVRDAIAEEVLGNVRSLAVVLVLTAFMFLIGVDYYAGTLGEVPTVLWPLYADSAVAVALGALSLATLLPTVGSGDPVTETPTNRALAYLHTLSFVWLVQFGLWPLVSLNLAFESYVSAPDAWIYYWGVLGTHLCFVGLALLFPTFARTTRGALTVGGAVGVANVVVDYWLGYYPPLLYEPGAGLALATLGIAGFCVWLASRSFRRLDEDPT